IYSFRERGSTPVDAAKKGSLLVATPVIFAILTTVAAFGPLMFIDGNMGKILTVIPTIVITVILVSLVESLFILPAHLSSLKKLNANPKKPGYTRKISNYMDKKLQKFIAGPYNSFLTTALKNKTTTMAVGVAILILSVGMVTGGIIKFTFFPDVEGRTIIVRLKMPNGSSFQATRDVITQLEEASYRVKTRLEKKAGKKTKKDADGQPIVFRHMNTVIGMQPSLSAGPHGKQQTTADPTRAEIIIELPPADDRDFSTVDATKLWREEVGALPGVKSLDFIDSLFTVGSAVQVELSSDNNRQLSDAVALLKKEVAQYAGVSEIRDDFEPGKYELKLKLKPQAATLGLTLADLARQVREGFYGAEAMRIQRGRNEVKVMVRYSEEERQTMASIDNMRIRGRNGVSVPFKAVADITYGRGYATITHANRSRTVTVFANIDEKIANASDINKKIKTTLVKWQKTKFPELHISFEGAQKEQKKTMGSVAKGFAVALFLIYILLAIPFKSYSQPLIVMTAIPFGIVGAILGHLILGYNLSVFSFFGIVALAGVVVNDSLVLIDAVNRRVKVEKMPINEAVVAACHGRFRPILLTSLTTFFGLAPMLVETSIQAQFLIPMAISLAFGVMFATLITLVLVPTELLILDSIHTWMGSNSSKGGENA
ncbi:efflux RND transporter permease subunit, partial [bacterium]|nr:efflux RND transporter permease subunit [bacterium]